MSWQTYVDSNLVNTGKVSKAAILGLDGNIWAKSADFNISAEEAKAISTNISNTAALQAAGVRVEEEKHFVLRSDENKVYTKKGEAGMCIVKCTQCILVGKYESGLQPGNCNDTVEKLGQYLIDNGY